MFPVDHTEYVRDDRAGLVARIEAIVDSDPRNPREDDLDNGVTWIHATGSSRTVHAAELDRMSAHGHAAEAQALMTLLDEHGARDFSALERRWGKYVAITSTPIRLHEFSSQGYSQGDWSEGVLAYDSTQTTAEGARATADEFADFLIGDVFGFSVTLADVETDDDGDALDDESLEYGGTETSVWGYYGGNHERSGLLDAARAEARGMIAAAVETEARKMNAAHDAAVVAREAQARARVDAARMAALLAAHRVAAVTAASVPADGLPVVTRYLSESDGALVVEIDGDAPDRVRVFMNDARILSAYVGA